MGRPKKVLEPLVIDTTQEPPRTEPTEKDKLLELYEELKSRNIRSLSDLEVQIARAE